jgi:hypothetical protein
VLKSTDSRRIYSKSPLISYHHRFHVRWLIYFFIDISIGYFLLFDFEFFFQFSLSWMKIKTSFFPRFSSSPTVYLFRLNILSIRSRYKYICCVTISSHSCLVLREISNPRGGEIFRTCPDRAWGPSGLLYIGYRVFSGGKERPRRDADPSSRSNAVVMKG